MIRAHALETKGAWTGPTVGGNLRQRRGGRVQKPMHPWGHGEIASAPRKPSGQRDGEGKSGRTAYKNAFSYRVVP